MKHILIIFTALLFSATFVFTAKANNEPYITGITLNESNIGLIAGETVQLIATILPTNVANVEVLWTSMNENVATVDETGLVTAVSFGTTPVFAFVIVDYEPFVYSSVCIVNVFNYGQCDICGDWDCEKEHIKCGICNEWDCEITHILCENPNCGQYDCTACTLCTICNTWNCTAEHIQCNICGDWDCEKEHILCDVCGDWDCQLEHIQCSICGEWDCRIIHFPVTGITIDHTQHSYLFVGDTRQLTTIITPENATNQKVIWTSRNPELATVVDGLVTARAPRSQFSVLITATTEDGNFSSSIFFSILPFINATNLTLNKPETTLAVGNSEQLTATVTPQNATHRNITWTSSDTNVATVENRVVNGVVTGLVTAVSEGTATITAATLENGNLTAECVVTITPAIPITGITLDKSQVILRFGETQPITATITPSNATQSVVWTTTAISGYNPIRFNNGQIITQNQGIARLTASTEDGSIEAHCYVGVAQSVTLNKSATRLIAGHAEQLRILPEFITTEIPNFNVTWTSSNTNVATVENGVVTAISEGTATITAQIENASFELRCTVTVETPANNTTDYGVEINGVFWATRNVDMPGTFADFPERPGMFYQWNRNIPWSTTEPPAGVEIPNWDISVPEVAWWEPETDPSPEGWRLPTNAELRSLSDASRVNRTWTTLNGVGGYRFTDRQTGNNIFLPAVGHRDENNGSLQREVGSIFASGCYWSSEGTPTTINNGINAFIITFSATGDLWCSMRRPAAFSVRSVKVEPFLPNGCNTRMPEWGGSLGTVSFATSQEWTVGNQIWSDAVQTSVCSDRSPSNFEFGVEGNLVANCRSNPGWKGDFFTWCAVVRYADVLCPYPWRVPTKEDFDELIFTLGGEEVERFNSRDVRDRLLNEWGGTYSGRLVSSGLIHQGVNATYFSQSVSNFSPTQSYALFYCNAGWIQHSAAQTHLRGGASLRCVRDSTPTTSVNIISSEREKTIIGYFNILGQKLPEKPTTGFFIILYDDGTTKKLIDDRR